MSSDDRRSPGDGVSRVGAHRGGHWPGDQWLASAREDNQVNVHSARSGQLALAVKYIERSGGVIFSADGASVLVLTPAERRVMQVWALRRGLRLVKD